MTGSKTLVTIAGGFVNGHAVRDQKILVDCGLFQGLKKFRLMNRESFPVNPSEIDAVVLTHAHLDHSGALPLLIHQGYCGKIFATPPTLALCSLLLPDAGKIQEEDAAFANKHRFSKYDPALALYTEKEGRAALQRFAMVGWREPLEIVRGVTLEAFPAGHILGAATMRLNISGTTLTFSGDIGRVGSCTLPSPAPPDRTDILVMESTYGDRCHDAADPGDLLARLTAEIVKSRGILLIPSFAVGRAQQLLYFFNRLKKENRISKDLPIFLNSPMATEATRIFCQFDAEQNLTREECRDLMGTAHFVAGREESKRLNQQKGPAVIISASGMASGGRVLHHLKSMAPDERNIILFVGFQASGTRGEAMIHGKKEIKIHGEMVPIRAKVVTCDSLSAHADQAELLQWLGRFSKSPRSVFLNHGEQEGRETLARKIQEGFGHEVHLPEQGEIFPV